jgi:hypothetical protein
MDRRIPLCLMTEWSIQTFPATDFLPGGCHHFANRILHYLLRVQISRDIPDALVKYSSEDFGVPDRTIAVGIARV